MSRIRVISFLTAFAAVLSSNCGNVSAQSIQWVQKPQYTDIRLEGMGFVVMKDDRGKFGIMDKDGEIIMDCVADSISHYINGASLVIDRQDRLLRLVGIITPSGFKAPDGDFYLGDYAYFSEGRIPVFDAEGYYGYLDTHANLKVKCIYEAVQPFTGNYAAVATCLSADTKIPSAAHAAFVKANPNKEFRRKPDQPVYRPKSVGLGEFSPKAVYTYVDKDGNQVKLPFKKVSYTSPFVNGLSLVRTNGEYMLCNSDFGLMKKVSSDDAPGYYIDPLSVPAPNYEIHYTSSLEPFEEDGKYGYRVGDEVKVVPQFESASQFIDGLAKVSVGGRLGLIKDVDGTFSVDIRTADEQASDPAMFKLELMVSAPVSWVTSPMTLICSSAGKDVRSNAYAPMPDGRRLYVMDVPKGELKFRAECDGFVLWDDSMLKEPFVIMTQEMLDNIKVSPSSRKVNADVHDRAYFSIYLENEDIFDMKSLIVEITGKNMSPVSREISLSSGDQVKIPVSINAKDIFNAEKRTVKVSLSSPDGKFKLSKTVAVTVNPF